MGVGAGFQTYAAQSLHQTVVPHVGMRYRTAEEEALLSEIIRAMEAELAQPPHEKDGARTPGCNRPRIGAACPASPHATR